MTGTGQDGCGGDGATEDAYSASEWRLRALSPLDGRYGRQMEPYAAAFSEGALIRERFAVEVAWLVHLSECPGSPSWAACPTRERRALDSWVQAFGPGDAAAVKDIEARTNHDVKAVEYYLKQRLTAEPGLVGGTGGVRPLRGDLRGRQQPGLRPDGAGRLGRGLAPGGRGAGQRRPRAWPWRRPSSPCWPVPTASPPLRRRSARSWPCSWRAGSVSCARCGPWPSPASGAAPPAPWPLTSSPTPSSTGWR